MTKLRTTRIYFIDLGYLASQ